MTTTQNPQSNRRREADMTLQNPQSGATAPVQAGYVLTDHGTLLAQLPDDNRWGFVLADEDQTWEGGFGFGCSWELLADNDPRITEADRERLGWLFERELAAN